MKDYLPAYGMTRVEWTLFEAWHHEATVANMTLRVIHITCGPPDKFHCDIWRDGECVVCWATNTLEEAKAAAEQWAEKELSK